MALAAALPAEQRPALQVLRTDTPTWQELLDARRHRGGWFVHSPGYTDLCSAAVPVRVKPAAGRLYKHTPPKPPVRRRCAHPRPGGAPAGRPTIARFADPARPRAAAPA